MQVSSASNQDPGEADGLQARVVRQRAAGGVANSTSPASS